MTIDGERGEIDYRPCRYGESRSWFRGPATPLDAPYIAVIGGSEVYGRYVGEPFAGRLAGRTGRRIVNLGIVNGGIDAFLRDPALMAIVVGAETVIVQVLGAHNLSNRYYAVHPRRNDRFLQQSGMMTRLYRDVDFSEFAFTRHLLITLRRKCPDRFAEIEAELRIAWRARMQELLAEIPGTIVLLAVQDGHDRGLGAEPLFVTAEMIAGVSAGVACVVHSDVSDLMNEPTLTRMVFPEKERIAAARMLPPAAHERVAVDLLDAMVSRNLVAAQELWQAS